MYLQSAIKFQKESSSKIYKDECISDKKNNEFPKHKRLDLQSDEPANKQIKMQKWLLPYATGLTIVSCWKATLQIFWSLELQL